MKLSPEGDFPQEVPLTGSLPNSQDFIASILFATIYSLLLPLVSYRIFKKETRCLALARPTIFVLARIVTFVLRALQSRGYNERDALVAVQVLLQCGWVLLIEPLISLSIFHVNRNYHPSSSVLVSTSKSQKRSLAHKGLQILHFLVPIALALIIYASSQYGSLDSPSTSEAVRITRQTSSVLLLFIILSAASLVSYAHTREHLPCFPALLLLGISTLLSITGVFKVVVYFTAPSSLSLPPKITFYILVCVSELLIVLLLFIPNLVRIFDIEEFRRKEREMRVVKEGTKGRYSVGVWGTWKGLPRRSRKVPVVEVIPLELPTRGKRDDS